VAEPIRNMTLRLCLLGSFQLESDAGRIRLPTRKAEALLAYLAVHAEAHSREKLAALLWGDFPDEQARASLRNALTMLRKALGHTRFLADRETVQLNPDAELWVDAVAFKTQADAFASTAMPDSEAVDVELYGGDLLADFYDEWILPEREHYRLLHLETLARLARWCRSRGDYQRAIEAAKRLLTAEPTDESAHRSLMQSYQALGDYDSALRQYEACQRVLRDELGVEPSSETTALYEQIRRAAATRSSPEAQLNNLPVPLTSFIGRERDLQELSARLGGDDSLAVARLYTLTGPGGAGKTRLALRVAAELAKAQTFADGVWWAELAAASDAAFVPQAAAKVFGLRESPGQPITDSLIAFMRPKRLRLILDNCEHLIVACAQLAEQLLQACPHLKILATSREALGIGGEQVWPVPSLDTHSEAIRLFVERAAAVKFGFTLNESNAQAITQICQRLDGMPFAIELAAARIKALSAEQIAARLDDRFNLLTTGSRAAWPRQQTLRATMDWSHDLLDEAEQTLFRRLAVFAGGFSLEAIEVVRRELEDWTRSVSNPPILRPRSGLVSNLDVLTRLIDKSLVIVGDARYRLLETTREYAADKLWLSGEESEMRRRHLQWYVQFVESAEPKLISAEQAEWQERLERDHANIRAALRWAIENAEAQLGLRLAGALWRFWDQRGYLGESRKQLERLLALPAAQYLTYEKQSFQSDRKPYGPIKQKLAIKAQTLCEVRELVPDKRLAWHAHMVGDPTTHADWEIELASDGNGGTKLTQKVFFVFGPLPGWVGILLFMEKRAFRQFDAGLQNIKQILEGRAQAGERLAVATAH